MVIDHESSRVLLLGAGFSRAVTQELSVKMPLTDELGALVLERLRESRAPMPSRPVVGGYFEAWLSRLAEPQPDLSEAENLHNQGYFADITSEMRAALIDCQERVLTLAPPDWLLRLVALLHRTRSTVVTFNYDLLLEAALNSAALRDWGHGANVSARHATRNLPPDLPRDGMFTGWGEAETFELIKLHGSLDCWWVGGDVTGATIVRDDSRPSFRTGDAEQAPAPRPPGRTPFLVPPASGKSQFYGNPITRELWRGAAAAIEATKRLDLIGYSIPITDLVTNGMLADRAGGRSVDVHVVDLYPKGPLDALGRLAIEATGHADGLAQYVADFEAIVAQCAWKEYDELPEDAPILVGAVEADLTALVHGSAGGSFELENPSSYAPVTRSRVGESGAELVRIADLVALRRRGAPLAIRHDGRELAIIGWERLEQMTGAGLWAIAVPSLAVRPSTH